MLRSVLRNRLLVIIGTSLPLVLAAPAVAEPPDAKNFVTHLTGANERPDPRETKATGQAIFHLSKDGTELSYKLIVANINNVVAAHIHVGSADVAGPVVAFLFGFPPVAPGGGRSNGVLAQGTITSADLIGPLAGMDLDDLIDEIHAFNTYVNVHTNDGVAPINTGPGDFPGGEIRGQIRVAGQRALP